MSPFLPDRESELAFVEQSSERFRQINQQQADLEKFRTANALRIHYRKYPWTNPGLAVAFSKWKAAYGGPAARGLARTASQASEAGNDPQDAVETYAMTKEFKRQTRDRTSRQFVKAFGEKSTLEGFAGGVSDLADMAPGIGAVKGIVEGAPLPEIITRAIPGAKASTTILSGGREVLGAVPAPDPVKGVVRAGFTALETPYQEIQGGAMEALTGLIGPIGDQAKNAPPGSAASRMGAVAGAPETRPLSTGGIALERTIQGKPVDLGEGFLPGGGIKEERDRRLREIASITYGGQEHFLTPGRTLAYQITEPGTVPYNTLSGAVDAAALITTDPANLALLKLGDVNRLRKGFDLAAETERAGGFRDAIRTFTHGPTVQQWGDGPKGAGFFKWVSGLNPREDFLTFQRATGWQIPPKQAASLLEQNTPEAVRGIFDPLAGIAVREQPNPWAFGSVVRQSAGTRRIFNTRSTDIVDLTGLDGPGGGLNQLYNWMKNAKIPENEISSVLYDLSKANSGFGHYEAVKGAMTAGQLAMQARGVPEYDAARVTHLFNNDLDLGSRYYVQQIADGTSTPGVVIGGHFFPETSPHLWVEALNPYIHLPNSKDIDLTLAKYGRILGIEGTGKTEAGVFADAARRSKYGIWKSDAFLTHLQSSVWVPLQLLRGAWTVRVIGEEQVRMAASGLSNVFSHPISHIGWVTSRDGALTNETLSQAMDARGALTREAGGFFQEETAGRVIAKGKSIRLPGDPLYNKSWADELIKLHSDPVANNVARTVHNQGDFNALKEAFYNPDGNLHGFYQDLRENPQLRDIIDTRSGSDAYIDSVFNRVHDMTAGDDDLARYIATGKYGTPSEGDISIIGREVIDEGMGPDYKGFVTWHKAGRPEARVLFEGADEPVLVPVSDLTLLDESPNVVRSMAHDGVRVDKDFTAYLDTKAARPERLVGDVVETDPVHKNVLDRTVRNLFSVLMAKPSNYLSRSPTFKQKYWQRVEELMPAMDARSQQLAVDVARGEKLPRRIIAQLEAAKGAKIGELGYSEADDLSKGFALDSVRDLLYDLNRRSQFFEATRLLFPFGEAWKEILTRWARIPFEHPEVVRKAQVGITELRESNPFGLIPGAVAEPFKEQGFLYHDPSTGQEMFQYPWSHHIADELIGVPIPFKAQASGLSLAFNVMPGIGPATSFAANALMDKFLSDPKYDPVRNFLFPYGEPDFGHGVLESFMPAWIQKWTTSLSLSKEDTRMLNNTANQILAYRVTAGEEDPHSQDELDGAFNRAFDAAKTLYRIRGTFQFGAPAAPQPEFLVKSKKGVVQLTAMRDEFFKLQQKDPDSAVGKFLNRFGEDAFYSTQSFTLSGAYSLPFTKDQVDWSRRNQDKVSKYPTVYGFFAPPGKPEDFDYDAYLRSIARGERTPIEGSEWTKHANDTLGWYWYDQAQKKIGLGPDDTPNKSQAEFLRDVRDKIHEAYPGWDDISGGPENKRIHAIEQLEVASQDRGLKRQNPELTTALSTYIEARNNAIATVEKSGGANVWNNPGYRTANRYAPLRAWLRDIGTQVLERYPAFKNVWTQVFEPDIGDEDDG